MDNDEYIIVGPMYDDGTHSALRISNYGLEHIVLDHDKDKSSIHEDLQLHYIGGSIYKIVSCIPKITRDCLLFGGKKTVGDG